MWNSWCTETAAGHWLLTSSSASSSSSSSYHHHAGRWFEVGKEASPKKRLEKVATRKEKKENMRKKMVSKKNFHGDEENEEEEEDDDDDEREEKRNKNISNNSSNGGGGGGGSVMEGSRCSRVNGRGWRCCQQTLVGYALCEHHLGKGRLRSMLSVRSRSSSKAVDNNISNDYGGEDCRLLPLSCKIWKEGDQGGEEEKLMMMMMKEKNKNKRKRIGIVKARSISSLLCQTHHAASSLQQK